MFGELLAPTHMIFILVVAMLIFGPKRLPDLGRSLGKGIKEFKGGLEGIDEKKDEEGKTKDQSGDSSHTV